MAKRAFYSFHYIPDNWRASQVRNMGVIEGNQPVSDNDWETVKKGGDAAIKKWIDDQLYGKSCAIILIGAYTANRHWINYEISTAWNEKKAVLGVYVHNLKDVQGNQTSQGSNPFDFITFKDSTKQLSSIAKAYNPPYSDSKLVYNYIHDNLAAWIDEAIQIRANS